jgi:hypothetical protein
MGAAFSIETSVNTCVYRDFCPTFTAQVVQGRPFSSRGRDVFVYLTAMKKCIVRPNNEVNSEQKHGTSEMKALVGEISGSRSSFRED